MTPRVPMILWSGLGLLVWLGVACSGRPALDDKAALESDAAWVAIFDGETLSGWTPKFRGRPLGENFADTFRVEDGVLRVDVSNYERFEDRFGHLFYERELSRYRLRLEYRFVGEQVPGAPGWAYRNSGVMIHGQTPQSLRLDQEFPVSLEFQLLGGAKSGERPTGNLCTPGTHVVRDAELLTQHCVSSSSPTFRGDRWVRAEIEVLGAESVRHFIEGELVMSYTAPQLDPRDADAAALMHEGGLSLSRGTISLQAESHPVEFRRIELLELP